MSFILPRRLANAAPAAARQFSRLTLIGRLAAPPEIYPTSTGTEIVKMTIATSHGYKENRTTSWWRVTSFESGARRDFLLSLSKGTMVALEADAQLTSYQDDNHVEHRTVNLIHRNLEVLARHRPRPEEGAEGVEEAATPEIPAASPEIPAA